MSGLNVVCVCRGNERYVWMYDDDRVTECYRSIGRFASNPDLAFSWYDAALATQRMRQLAKEQSHDC